MSSEVETSLAVSVERVQHGQTIVRDSSTPVGMTEKLFAALEVYRDIDSRSAAMNMAIDEALLERAELPSIRFYRWNHPALSFGYFGQFTDVADHQPDRDIVRRWTGGGIVLHGEDLTYSIVIPASDAAFAESSTSVYEKTHAAIRAALGITVAALYERRPKQDSAVIDRRGNECFANPVHADVMVDGRKIAGAAQRRTQCGLLQQGSIQKIDLSADFEGSLARELSEDFRERTLEGSIVERAGHIAASRYAADAWTRRR